MRRSLLLIATVLLAACGAKPEAAAPAAPAAPISGNASGADLGKGKTIYLARCAFCHGELGDGDTPIGGSYPGANLADGKWLHGGSADEVATTIVKGVPETPMQGFGEMMKPDEVEAVAAYVRSLEPPAAK